MLSGRNTLNFSVVGQSQKAFSNLALFYIRDKSYFRFLPLKKITKTS